MLMEIAHAVAGTSLDLHISVYVTCLCNPEEVPAIPNMDVVVLNSRPSIARLLTDLVSPPRPGASRATAKAKEAAMDDDESISEEAAEHARSTDRLNWVGLGGGVGVCAAGPEAMTRAAHNAVARVSLTRGIELGGVALHAELFAM